MSEKRGGRPRLPPDARPVVVSLKLPPWLYDHYCREALKGDATVHGLLRRAILRGVSGSAKTRRRRKPTQDSPGSPLPGRG
jgi:hypothetical protein